MKLLALLSSPLPIFLKLSLLPLLFLVLGGPSVIDNTRAVDFTGTEAKCQFKSEGSSGPIYECKDPKTGKTHMLRCKNPPKSIMPPKDRPTVMAIAKLEGCRLLDGLEDIDKNG